LYRYLEHTADILIEATGNNFKEALEESAHAMFNVIGSAEPKIKINIACSAPSKEQLVVYFLGDLLSEMEINQIVFSKVEIIELVNFDLKAIAYGDKILPKDQVKAVTHHMLKVEESKNMCKIQVLLDV